MHPRPAVLRFLHVALLLVLVLGAAYGPAARANWLFSYPPNQVTLDSGHRNNVFTVGDPVQFSLTIFNYGTYVTPGTVRYEVRDYWGSIAASGTVAAPVPNGPTTLSLPTITQPGWYKLYLHQATPVAPWGDSMGGTMFVIFRPNANFPLEPSENLPLNSGGSDGGDEVARGVLGMGPERHAVTDASQPAAAIATLAPAIAQDKQYYTPYDPQRPRPLLVAVPNGVGSSNPTQQAANLAGLTQIVQQFHNDVKYWEPLNEPQGTYSPADYINKELIPFYNTVKAVDPTCKVLGPAIVTLDPGGSGLSWIQGFLQAGGAKYIDAFSFHAYNNVNGDLTLARESLDGLQSLLTQYGGGKLEKWQTEQGYFAACYGAYQPRLQGRWTMLQMMVYEQYGIPKEHNHLWYDKSHGFWDFPAFWENEDGLNSFGSFDPAAPLMRVWSEELYGTNFQSAYNLGALGNKLYVGSLFGGPGKQVAAFQSGGRTDGSLTLSVTGGSSIHVVSAFGVASDLPVSAGQAVLPVPELPVYVELAPGQTIQPVPVDYGADLALTPGTTATSSGNGQSPLNASYPDDPSKIINGTLENWYYTQANGDHPWMGNDASFPAWVQVTLPKPATISHAVVYAGVPWQNDGSLLDYELQYDQNGQWVTLAHPTEPTNVVDFFTPTVFCTADSFYSDRDVFVHDFAPVTTQKVRLLVHNTTFGGAPTQDIVTAGGQPGPQQITLREIELYGPLGQSPSPITGGPLSIGFLGDSITYGIGDQGGPGCYDWALTDLAKNGYQPTGVNYGNNGASVASFYQQTAGPLQAFEAAGVSVVSIMLGTNDAQAAIATSPQMYHDKLLSIINSFLAPGTGIQKVILHYSPYIQPSQTSAAWDSTADARLQSFQPQIDSLCNGTTILQGDKLAYSFFQQHPEQGDGVHPNPQGHQDLGDLWAIAITNALGGTNTLPYPAGTPTTSAPTLVNDTDGGLTYSGPGWGYYAGRGVGDFQDDVHATTSSGDSVSYTFTGTSISVLTETNSDEGNVQVYLDGTLQATVNAYSSARKAQQTLWSASGLAAGSHTLKLVKASGSYMLLDALSLQPSTSSGGPTPSAGPSPYGGSPVMVAAGVTKVEAENYDLGGEGVAYHDINNGGQTIYRSDNIGLSAVAGASNGYCVGWTAGGEWDSYTLNVAAAGVYTLTAAVGSPTPGGLFHLEFGPVGQIGGAGIVKTGEFTVPNTGSYTAFQPVSVSGVTLPAGPLWMRLVLDSTYPCTFDDFTLAPSPMLTTISVSPGSAPLNTGGTQQFTATAYDQNGSAMTPQPALTWSVASGGVGTVNASGLYSAGTAAGSAVVQASSGGVSAAASVTVSAPGASGTGSVSFYPRPGSANRMQGGQFQGSADGVNYTVLYTIPGVPADGQWTSVPLSADPKTFRYLRYLSPNGGWGNVSEVAFYSGTGAVKLTGTPFGSPGSYNNDGNDFSKVFDGNTSTFFDGPGPNGNFAGIDQGGTSAPVPTPVYQINAGGGSAGTFAADEFVQGGSADTGSAAIDVSAAHAAPQAVYQSERWGTFTYTLPNLTPGGSYTLRLHFAETFFGPGMLGGGGTGSRQFNAAVNGVSVLTNFDIFAAAGGADKAVVETFPAVADSNGSVTVTFTNGSANFPKLSGLELLH